MIIALEGKVHTQGDEIENILDLCGIISCLEQDFGEEKTKKLILSCMDSYKQILKIEGEHDYDCGRIN